MRSLRLDPELDEKVRRAAALKGESVSEFLRHAAEDRANDTLGRRRRETFSDVAGVVHGGGEQARRSGKSFSEALAEKHRR